MAESAVLSDDSRKTALDEETRLTLGRELGQEFNDSYSASTQLRFDVTDYRDQYESILPEKKLKWQANIAIPSTKHMINSAAIRISSAAFGADPIFEVEAEDPAYDEVAQEEENYHQVWNERNRLKTKGYMAVRDGLIAGQCWLKNGVRRTGKPPPDWNALMPDIPLRLDQLDVVPTCDYVITEDMMLLPFTAPNFKSAKGAFSRVKLRWNDIVLAQKSKVFYPDAVELLKAKWQKDNSRTYSQEQMGIETQVPRKIWSAEFECWEGIYRWTRPGDDTEQEWLILAYYPLESAGDAIILRCKPYKEVYGDTWFFVPIIIDPKPNSMWGGSMCKSIQGLQNFTNSMFNGCTDAVQISLLPPMKVGMGTYTKRKQLKWGPLEMWPVTSPTDVLEPMSGSPSSMAALSAGMGMIDLCRQMMERVTGQSDPTTTGKVSEERRTAFEIGLVAQAGDVIVDHQVILVEIGTEEGHGIEAFAQNQMAIIRNFLPKWPITYKSNKQGQGPWPVVKPEWHEGSYRFIPHGNSAGANPEVRFKRAQVTLGAMMQDPFVIPSPFDLQHQDVLLEKVRRIYKVRRDFYEAMGCKHPERNIGGEPQTFEEAVIIAANINPAIGQAIAMQMAQQAMRAEAQGAFGAPGGMVPVPGETAAGGFGGGIAATGAGGGAGVPGLGIPTGMEQIPA